MRLEGVLEGCRFGTLAGWEEERCRTLFLEGIEMSPL